VRVFGLVPAAGRSERFGSAKLLAKWQGRELLGHVLLKLKGARAASLLAGIMVVHRAGDEAILTLIREYRAYPVALPGAGGELSDTIRTGIEAILQRGPAIQPEAALICHADQPLLRLEVIHAVVDAWARGGALAARPVYRDTPAEPGLPMLVDRSLWHLAQAMKGDSGFAPVLAAEGIEVRGIPVAGRNPDVDTPADLAALAGAPGAGAG
jgi:CTP:molybdopterin cytidylyltransferase MocA